MSSHGIDTDGPYVIQTFPYWSAFTLYPPLWHKQSAPVFILIYWCFYFCKRLSKRGLLDQGIWYYFFLCPLVLGYSDLILYHKEWEKWMEQLHNRLKISKLINGARTAFIGKHQMLLCKTHRCLSSQVCVLRAGVGWSVVGVFWWGIESIL